MTTTHVAPRPFYRRWQQSDVLAAGLLVTCVVKLALLLTLTPIVGYANNYDFVRQSACVGLWQSYPDRRKDASMPERPVNSLIFDGEVLPDVCMRSADNIFPFLVTLFHRTGSHVDFREVAAVKIGALLAMAAAFIRCTPKPSSRLLFATMFVLTFGDVAYISYVNTLYLEFSVIVSAFFAGSIIILLVWSPFRPSYRLLTLLVITIVWLGLSKEQYWPLAAALSLLCAGILVLRGASVRMAIWLVLLAIALPWVYGDLNPAKHSTMRAANLANKTDTFFATVLPAAASPEQALALLHLPVSCVAGIGKNWYAAGLQNHLPCPEIERTSRIRLLSLFVADPATFFRPLRDGTESAIAFYPSMLGNVESTEVIRGWRYKLCYWTSASALLLLLPRAALTAGTLAVMLAGPIALALTAIVLLRGKASPVQTAAVPLGMVGLGGATAFYAVASSVFGDGLVDVSKHAVVLLMCLTCAIVGCVLLASTFVSKNLGVGTADRQS